LRTARLLEAEWRVVRAVALVLRKQRELAGPEAMGILARAFYKSGREAEPFLCQRGDARR
jgi:hypothetical protein